MKMDIIHNGRTLTANESKLPCIQHSQGQLLLLSWGVYLVACEYFLKLTDKSLSHLSDNSLN